LLRSAGRFEPAAQALEEAREVLARVPGAGDAGLLARAEGGPGMSGGEQGAGGSADEGAGGAGAGAPAASSAVERGAPSDPPGPAPAVAPLSPAELGDLRLALVEIFYQEGLTALYDAGEPAAADVAFARAIELLEQQLAIEPARPAARYRLAVLHGQGRCTALVRLGRRAEALAACRRARELLDVLVREDPSNGRWQYANLWEHIRAGNLARNGGDREGGRREYQLAARAADEIAARAPMNTDWMLGCAAAYSSLAAVEEESGRLPDALAAARRAQQILARAATLGDSTVWLQRDQLDVGLLVATLEQRLGQFAAARRGAADLAALLANTRELAPEASELRVDLVGIETYLGKLFLDLGEVPTAQVHLVQAAEEGAALRAAGRGDAYAFGGETLAWLLLGRVDAAAPALAVLRAVEPDPAEWDPDLAGLVREHRL
jgi:tetratricopeptide (TPR) repeat protein